MQWPPVLFRLEALSSAISEKDAQIALLEISGVNNATTADQFDKLRSEKKLLMDKLKIEVSKWSPFVETFGQ